MAEQLELDNQNLVEIEQIIEEIGYPETAEVGVEYEMVAFLVIQQAGLEIIEKYLPWIEEAIV